MKLDKILEDPKALKDFTKRFKAMAEREGEFILEPLPGKYIIHVFKEQGFWSGDGIRIDYNTVTDTFSTQPKLFG